MSQRLSKTIAMVPCPWCKSDQAAVHLADCFLVLAEDRALNIGQQSGYARGWRACRAVIGGAILQFRDRAKMPAKGWLTRVYSFIEEIEPPIAQFEKPGGAPDPVPTQPAGAATGL